MNSTSSPPSKRSTILVVFAWLVVTIPAAWGVSQTVQKSLALFTSAPPAASAPAPASAPAAPASDQKPGH